MTSNIIDMVSSLGDQIKFSQAVIRYNIKLRRLISNDKFVQAEEIKRKIIEFYCLKTVCL